MTNRRTDGKTDNNHKKADLKLTA